MESSQKPSTKSQYKKKELKIISAYSKCLITRNVSLPISAIGKNMKETIENNINANFEGKCVVEGYVRPNSTKILTYSSGIIQGINVNFEVVIQCDVCFPVEGMLLQCVAKNITKAGIRAESVTETPSPFVVFIARDHHYNVPKFASVKEGDKFTARVIGQRFELNDKYISIIAELVQQNDTYTGKPRTKQPALVLEE
jgi:DNA-directed RNA polymerase subunit E'/Rpb7